MYTPFYDVSFRSLFKMLSSSIHSCFTLKLYLILYRDRKLRRMKIIHTKGTACVLSGVSDQAVDWRSVLIFLEFNNLRQALALLIVSTAKFTRRMLWCFYFRFHGLSLLRLL